MNRYIFFAGVLLIISINGLAQEKSEKMMVYNVTLDTTLKADYFVVGISVSEYVRYERISKKNVKSYIVSLDSLAAKLLSKLSELGFNQRAEKSTITEVDHSIGYYRYQTDKKLFQVTYNIRVSGKDSIDYLFKNIDRDIVSGMKVQPEVNDNTKEAVKAVFITKGMKTAEKYAAEMADSLGQKIIKSKYQFVFYDGGYYNNDIDFNKKFQIDFRDILYKITVSYTYYLGDKQIF